MRILLCLTFLLSIKFNDASDFRWRRELNCFEETKKCFDTFACSTRMYRVLQELCGQSLGYSVSHQSIIASAAKVCPKKCAEELLKFTTKGQGKYLMDCECPNRDSTCLTMKARVKKCIASGLGWPMNNTKPSCSEARKNCSAKTECKKAMHHFLRQCSRLISGVECTDECRTAQNGFLELSIGKLLENECECDGSEEQFCRGIRAHYQALCLSNRVTRSGSQSGLNTTSNNPRSLASWNYGSVWNLCLCLLAVMQFLGERDSYGLRL